MPGVVVLRKTSAAVNSLFPHRSPLPCSSLDFGAGILFFDFHGNAPGHLQGMCAENDSVVGLSCGILSDLCISSGSWVVVRNMERNISRAARVLALDPPLNGLDAPSPTPSSSFPSCTYTGNAQCVFSSDIAYVSPMLAFNLSFHVPWLHSLVTTGNSSDSPFGLDKTSSFKLRVEVLDVGQVEMASHMRISYVKIPVLSSGLDGSLGDNQDQVDRALERYFEAGRRIVSAGDLISVDYGCSTIADFYNSFHFGAEDRNTVFVKVISLEPPAKAFLRVDDKRTALVLSGSVSNQLPPLVLRQRKPWFSSHHAASVRELVSLVAPWLHPDMVPLRISTLLVGPAGVGKRTVVRLVAAALGIHVVEYNCYELLDSSDSKTCLALNHSFEVASRYAPSILLLRRFGALVEESAKPNPSLGGAFRIAATIKKCITDWCGKKGMQQHVAEEETAGSNQKSQRTGPVILIATAEDETAVKTLRQCFTHEMFLTTPDEGQRLELLKHLLSAEIPSKLPADMLAGLNSISSQTAGLVPRDLRAVAADVGAFALDDHVSKSCDAIGNNPSSIDKALEQIKRRTASVIGTPKVPNVKWEDIGGLETVKRAILDIVQVPLLHRELFTSGLRQRSGILLYGPPGTGKTLLAKAVATECSLNFISVKGPELINMFIGESEKNVREIFLKARGARPCVIFFDELDALAPARGASGDSGGVMDRVVSQMLAEIDGLSENTQDLFVIGATNRPDLIDSALLRPGRFDKLLYVGISPDPTYRVKVLSALARKFNLDEDVSLELVARKCPDNFTGADTYALCADAWMHAVKRKAANREEDESGVVVNQEDFLNALAELKPSLSSIELAKYEQLRVQFQGVA